MKSPSRDAGPDLRTAALAYVRRGWPVFPLTPGNKTPLTKNGFKDAVPNADTPGIHAAVDMVSGWWTGIPNANIGLATGVAFDVLDIDGPEGLSGLRSWLTAHDAADWKHTGPVGITGKGWHYLFAPTGQGNRAKLSDAPIDYRGAGGYIVAPPSLHPLGHYYRWDPTRGPDTPLPEAPPWLIELLGDRKKSNRPVLPTHIQNLKAPNGLPELVTTTTGALRDSRPDILQTVVQMGGAIHPKGRYHVTNCFFHDDPGPSMVLYAEDQTFHCYGCDALGDSHNLLSGKDMNGKPVLTA